MDNFKNGISQTDSDTDNDLIIKSDQFCNIKISVAKVYIWFNLIHDLAGDNDLQMALELCDTYKKSPEEKEAINMIKALILQEASGYIVPPFNICLKYREIFDSKNGDTVK